MFFFGCLLSFLFIYFCNIIHIFLLISIYIFFTPITYLHPIRFRFYAFCGRWVECFIHNITRKNLMYFQDILLNSNTYALFVILSSIFKRLFIISNFSVYIFSDEFLISFSSIFKIHTLFNNMTALQFDLGSYLLIFSI